MQALNQEDGSTQRYDLVAFGDDDRRGRVRSLKKKAMGASTRPINPLKTRSNRRVSNCQFASISIDDVRDEEEEETVNAFRQNLIEKDLLSHQHDDYLTLLRFLNARKFDIDKAVHMWVEMLNWRKEYGADSILKHLKDMNDPLMEDVLMETENMLARGRMDLPLSLCFATLRGDDLLLQKLLKRGLDPNESDNNGGRALVTACAQAASNVIYVSNSEAVPSF